MTSQLPSTCTMCGGAVDASLLGGVCPCCLLGDVVNGPGEAKAGQFEGHELLAEIARGGMGVVYRARQHEPDRLVALKTLRSASLDSPEAMARFQHEAEVMVTLDHAAVLPVYHCGEADGIPFFTMKLVEGGTLAERIGSFSGQWRGIAELTARVCDGVQHAHERGVLHRDLKPGNILFDTTGAAYVSDFGIAKLADSQNAGLTLTMSMIGTPHYLAPEIAAGSAKAASVSSDVWSLGVILYELLTGQKPFKGVSMTQVLRALELDEAIAPRKLQADVPRDLEVITLKAMAREPVRRYSSAHALAEDLRAWLEGRPISARAVPLHERAWLWSRRNPWLAGTAMLLVAALLAAVASLSYGFRSAKRETENVRAAQGETRLQLRESLLHQARLGRVSREMGWRQEGINALRKAWEIRGGDDVRDELAAHLAGFDFTVEPVPGLPTRFVSPSQKLGLSIDADKSISLLTLPDGRKLFDLPVEYDDAEMRVAFDHADRWMAIGPKAGTRVYAPLDELRELARFDGWQVIGASDDDDRLHLWDESGGWRVIRTSDWTELARGTADKREFHRPLLRGAFQPRGGPPLLALCAGEFARLTDWRTGALAAEIKCARKPERLSWAGSMLIISCGELGEGVDFLNGRRTLFGPGFGGPVVIAPAAADTELITSSGLGLTALWHTATGQRLAVARGIAVASMAADEERLSLKAPSGSCGRIVRPEMVRLLPQSTLNGRSAPYTRTLAFSPDGRLLAAHDMRNVVVFDTRAGRVLSTQSFPNLYALMFSSDGRTLLALHRGGVRCWTLELREGRLAVSPSTDLPTPKKAALRGGRALQDGTTFFTSDFDHKLYRMNRDTRLWEDLKVKSPEEPQQMDVSPDGRWFFGMRTDRVVVARAHPSGIIYLTADMNSGLSALSPDGKRLLYVDWQHRWQVYDDTFWLDKRHHDTRTMKRVGGVSGEQCAAWSPTGRWFAASPDGRSVSLVNGDGKTVYLTLTSPVDLSVECLLISADERTLAVQRAGGSLELWYLDKAIEALRALGVSTALPAAPPRLMTPPELAGDFLEAEPLAWSPVATAAAK